MIHQLIKKSVSSATALLLVCSGLSAQNMLITSGCNVIMTGPVNLVLNNAGLVNNGNFVAGSGTVKFTGTTDAGISGTSAAFNNLVVAKSSANVVLNCNVAVAGNIVLNGGNVQLGINTLDLGNTGSIIGENDGSHITSNSTGIVNVTRSFVAGVAQNPGNIGAELLVNTAASFTIKRQHMAVFLPPAQTSIQRTFTINGPSVPVFRLRFFYLSSELSNNDPSLITLWSVGIKTSSVMLGKDGSDDLAEWVSQSGLSLPNQSARFTLGDDPTGGGIILDGGKNRSGAAIAEVIGSVNSAKAYPNPVHDRFILNLVSERSRQITISLIDQSGRTLQQKVISCVTGTNTLTWDVSGVAAGMYYLQFSDPAFKNITISKQ